MKFTVLTLFPEIIDAYFGSSIMAKALSRALMEYRVINIRDYALDRHRTCDDTPYGGGAGMLMLAEPLGRALEAAGAVCHTVETHNQDKRVIYLTPSGRRFDQALAREFSCAKELVLLCGRYEGIDQRVIDNFIDDEVSVGDYVLSSGETAALIVIDATYRLVEKVISPASLEEESFDRMLLEYPQYTRPEIYGTVKVPEVLLSGHHENIRRWRLEKRVEKTLAQRPDLIRLGEDHSIYDAETREIIEQKRRDGMARGKDERN
jgi:tRNA (guanine37-N1)-methyltransferase